MVTRNITVKIPTGLEARPVAMLVQVASQFESSIYIESQDGTSKKVNAKSIMGMMTLGVNSGDKVVVTTSGPDEEDAIQKIEEYLNNEKAV